jgi:hypothetical protein
MKPPYYYWKNALPQLSIDRILNYIETECEFLQGTIIPYSMAGGQNVYFPKERRCEVYLFDIENCSHIIEREVCLELIRLGREVNEIWNFDLDFSNVQIQIARYNEPNDFFDWHNDDHILNDNWPRKLTISIVLKECEEGGMFEFENFKTDENGNSTIEYEGKLGNAVAFPSYEYHKVNPVTKGTRISLVGWFHGKSWA